MDRCLWIVCLIICCGCSRPPPIKAPMDKSLQDCAKYGGKYLTLEGYLTVPYPAHNHKKGEVNLFLASEQQFKVYVTFAEGQGANQSDPLPDSYTEASLKVHDKDGQVVTSKDRVRITGWMTCIDDIKPPGVQMDKGVIVEKLPPEQKQ